MKQDAILAVVVVTMLSAPFFKAGLPWVGGMFLAIAGVVALFEHLAITYTGLSVSQQFWAYSEQSTGGAIFLASLITIGGVGLGVHFLWKVIKGLL